MPVLVFVVLLGGCSQAVRYTDELTDPDTGRSLFVRVPAHLGGFVGFVGGIPVDIAALPITWPVYLINRRSTRRPTDAVSIFLFPSFVLWRAGALIAAPFDALEYAVLLGRRRPSRTREENAEIEYEIDLETLPSYPVEWIYPPRPNRTEAAAPRVSSALARSATQPQNT